LVSQPRSRQSPDSPPAPDLREKVRDGATNRPGIYRFLGPRGEVLYVGKSVRIRTRLLSYFRHGLTGRLRELLRVAEDVEWEYVPNEFEALLRELRQIRGFRPRFNVRHRRERRFAWVKVTREAAPRLVATRRPVPDGSRYFGPFPARRALPGTLRDLAHAVGLRDCPGRTPVRFADQLDLLGSGGTPLCPRADLGSCPGPCAPGRCSEGAYGRNVHRALAFLEGRDETPLEQIRERMEASARRREYEHAGRLRDRLAALERLRSDIAAFGEFLEGLTFVYRVPGEESPGGSGRGYLIVAGRVRLSFDWSPAGRTAGPGRRIATTIGRLAGEPPPPPEAMTPGDQEELFLVARWFRDRPLERDRTVEVCEVLRTGKARATPRPVPSPGRSRTPSS